MNNKYAAINVYDESLYTDGHNIPSNTSVSSIDGYDFHRSGQTKVIGGIARLNPITPSTEPGDINIYSISVPNIQYDRIMCVLSPHDFVPIIVVSDSDHKAIPLDNVKSDHIYTVNTLLTDREHAQVLKIGAASKKLQMIITESLYNLVRTYIAPDWFTMMINQQMPPLDYVTEAVY